VVDQQVRVGGARPAAAALVQPGVQAGLDWSGPRDGGIQDLLDEATRDDRRFAAVVCESIERVARRTYFGTKIEYELEQVGVPLFAADEPMPAEITARTATRRPGGPIRCAPMCSASMCSASCATGARSANGAGRPPITCATSMPATTIGGRTGTHATRPACGSAET
jgi:hypothetical protein